MIRAAQTAFWLAQAPGYARFKRALADPERAQRAALRSILRRNADCELGRRHGFEGIASAEDYQARVPLCAYADLEPDIQRMRRGETDVLFRGGAALFEPSGASASGGRLIPYNAALQRQFQAGLAPWVFDLYRREPALLGGPAYWSLTPAGALKREKVGFETDAAYFGRLGAALVERSMAVPASVAAIEDLAEFRRSTLRHLVRARGLRFISVWNPSFLGLLMEGLPELSPLSPAELWPELRVISCWADAHAAAGLPALRALFPQAEIQPKGLMATESFVSLPFEGVHPLALLSGFFEFLDADGRARTAWQLEAGKDYSVLLSTDGGLYRYRLQDRVRVTGFLQATPCLRFLGKEDCVSDTCGEKLEEAFVAAALQRVFERQRWQPAFSVLAPVREGGRFAYVLYCEGEPDDALPQALEDALSENFHYAYSRRLQQLGPIRVQALSAGSGARYLAQRAAEGRQLGAVKALALDPRMGAGGLGA